MASIFEMGGQQRNGGGILAPAMGQQQVPGWGGIFAALKDASSYLGAGGSTDNFSNFQQNNQQNQMRQQLLAGLSAEDPAQRQQAYTMAALMGVPTDAIQKQRASADLPKLLQSMQPSTQTVAPTQAALPNLPGQTVQGGGFNFDSPGMSPREAIMASDSPELQSMYAGSIMDEAMKGPQYREVGNSLVQLPGLGGGDPRVAFTAPPKPEATPDSVQIAQTLFPNDPKAQHDYLIKNSPANLRSITNIHTGADDAVGWQLANDPKTNTQYRFNVRTGQAIGLDGKPYQPGGLGKIDSGQVRSAQSVAVQRYVREHPDATSMDVAQFAADFGATGKSVGAFSTGKQGDLIRSFNVGISHLNTLDGLVDALHNGDVQGFNKLGNAYSQQTGNPAPSNFDAAKAIVGDEIIKAIVGGGGALADRENAQNQINRANSPQQLRGVIKTYKELMGGQLQGLKKQYTDTTHRNNFDSRLTPDARSELEGRKPAPPPNTAALPRLPASNAGWTVKRR